MEAAQAGGPSTIEDQIAALVAAVRECRHVLEHVCLYHDDWLDEELRETIERAFRELEPVWEQVISSLNTNVVESLQSAGLLGAQGEVKAKGLAKRAKEFFRSPSRRLFRRAAKWMNIVLGSLASVVPGGEALNEFKQVVEAAIRKKDG